MGISVLEQKHMISTILFLADSGRCTRSELYRAVSANPRMPEKLDLLEEAGLIMQELSDGSQAVRISPTDLGTEVSATLSEIDGMMS